MLDLDEVRTAPQARAEEAAALLPPQPKSLRDTGLDQAFLVELVAKTIYAAGKIHLPLLAGKLKLSVNVLREVLDFMLGEQLAELTWRGDTELDVQYQLTGSGKLRAADYLARSRYLGPAPVTLAAYRDVLRRQGARQARQGPLPAAELQAAFADDVIDPDVRDTIGAALHAGRSLLLYGPSGSGKTTLARKLGRLQHGLIAVPHALLIDERIVQVHDPAVHLAPSPVHARQFEERRSVDARWTLCQRPAVCTGAELDGDMLELRHDEAAGVFHAPPQLLANGGLLIVDDLGRQRAPAAQLLNRITAALESGVDQLRVQGNHKVALPFDALVLFATNLPPHELLDDAQLRRVGYKVNIGPLSEANFRLLFRHQCRAARVVLDELALDHLVHRLHGQAQRPLLASCPREIVSRIVDFASYADVAPRLSVAAIDQAWRTMFAGAE
ncbi:MAG TPA: ATP-binding protein [Telluria sp.]|nr:ATP-binding protein [Telluria sp.]